MTPHQTHSMETTEARMMSPNNIAMPLSQLLNKGKGATPTAAKKQTLPLSQLLARTQNQPKPVSSLFGKASDIAGDVSTGAGKSALDLIRGTGELGGSLVNWILGKGFTPSAKGSLEFSPLGKKIKNI